MRGRDRHRPTLLSSPSCQDVREAVKKSDVILTVKLHGGLHSPHLAELINLQSSLPPPSVPPHTMTPSAAESITAFNWNGKTETCSLCFQMKKKNLDEVQ